jgi:Metal-dependent amidase/aminoacylase/carboxypeptidase
VDALEQECPEEGICTVCRIEGGNNSNIIPSQAFAEGTVRFLEDRVGERLEAVFRSITERICSAAGVSFELDYQVTYPVTKTSPLGAALAEEVTRKYLGG